MRPAEPRNEARTDATVDPQPSGAMSRRDVLKNGSAAIAGGASATLMGRDVWAASQAPAVVRADSAGRRFRAFVRSETEVSLQELRLRPLEPRHVLLRTEATQCCYSIVSEVLTPSPQTPPKIIGHGGVGVVEAVGTAITRVKVGDRVIVANTPQCGQCYNCLRGRADMCEVKRMPLVPIAETSNGTGVTGHNNYGGFADLMVAYEEYCVPVTTSVSSVELAILGCVGGAGLAATTTFVPVAPGTNVAVLGCGPIGLSAVQGARLMGANQIIAVEPIRYRRELALELGATTVLDPNVEGDGLVNRIRDMCKGSTSSIFAGGRDYEGNPRPYGPDFVIEAVGGTRFPPTVETGPDPTGIRALEQAWEMTCGGGHVTTTGVPSAGNVSIPASMWAIQGRTHHSGQLGGVNSYHDQLHFVRLIERGLFNAKALATSVFPLEETREAFQAAADRTTVASIVVPG